MSSEPALATFQRRFADSLVVRVRRAVTAETSKGRGQGRGVESIRDRLEDLRRPALRRAEQVPADEADVLEGLRTKIGLRAVEAIRKGRPDLVGPGADEGDGHVRPGLDPPAQDEHESGMVGALGGEHGEVPETLQPIDETP